MGFLLQISMSCLRALLRQVAGAGGRWKQGAGAGCRCRVLVRAVVLVLGAGAVSWQSAWWRLGAVLGAGCARGGDRVPGAGIPVLGRRF